MAEVDLTGIAGTSIATPASGVVAVYDDSADKRLRTKDDVAFVRNAVPLQNWSVAAQSPTATTRTYITGSQIAVPRAGSFQIGTMFRWRFNMTKNANGTATSTIDIAFGTAGTTADTAQVSFTKPAGTAVADEAFCEVEAIVRGPLSASCVVSGEFTMIHNLQITGHAIIPCVAVNTISSTFNILTPTFVGLCITTGASDAITIQQCQAQAWNL